MEHYYDEVVELRKRPNQPHQSNTSSSSRTEMSSPSDKTKANANHPDGGAAGEGTTIAAIIANTATAAVMPAFEKIEVIKAFYL